jgi:hypothetical protein
VSLLPLNNFLADRAENAIPLFFAGRCVGTAALHSLPSNGFKCHNAFILAPFNTLWPFLPILADVITPAICGQYRQEID